MEFSAERDTLWLTGDLVNRGPRSGAVLDAARAADGRTVVTLGNHDLHLLARLTGVAGAKPRDTLDDVLARPGRDALVEWLRTRPLLHRADGHVMVHAGLLPGWSLDEAESVAREVEEALRGPQLPLVLRGLYEREFPGWHAPMTRTTRLALALCVFTRMRMVRADGRLELSFKGPPDEAPAGLVPWYAAGSAAPAATTVVFGHWSALGFARVRGGVCLDSGCYRGATLTALRLDDGAVFGEPNAD